MFNIFISVAINTILVILLLLCSYEDIKNKKIPNKYTIPVLIAGLILMTINGGFEGLKDSFYGFLLGFAIFLIPFLIGAMGAGDVKLMAAIGALKGFTFTFYSLVATGIVGGVMVIVYVIYKKQLLQTFINMFGIMIRPFAKMIYLNSGNKLVKKVYDFFESVKQKNSDLYIPYAIPISVGSIGILVGSIFNLL